MRDDPHVVALVTRASGGDQGAWHELVDRYAPLVYTICTRYRLSNHDIEDVGQNVWLLLVEQLGKLREPAALPGWLATTTARECLRVVTAASRAERLGTGLDDSVLFVDDAVIDEELLWLSGTRRCARPSPSCRRAASSCCRCCCPTRRILTRISTASSASRSAASGRSGLAAWSGCAGRALLPPSERARKRSTYGEASQVRNDWDDDRLLVALGQALKARQAVPLVVHRDGQERFRLAITSRPKLAQLTYDSNEDRLQAAVTRSETASIRALTFTSAHLSVELEVTGNSLLGQLLPAREGELEIHTRAGEISTTDVDEIGCFSVDPIPDSPFRLRCRTADGTDVADRVDHDLRFVGFLAASFFAGIRIKPGAGPSVLATESAGAGGAADLVGGSGLSAPTGLSSGPYR